VFHVISDINGTCAWVLVHFPDLEGAEWPQLLSNYDIDLGIIIHNKLLDDILSNVPGKTV
jgi:hypothetical protein